jgi:hypothetical protein
VKDNCNNDHGHVVSRIDRRPQTIILFSFQRNHLSRLEAGELAARRHRLRQTRRLRICKEIDGESVCLFVCLSVCLSVCLFVSFFLSLYLFSFCLFYFIFSFYVKLVDLKLMVSFLIVSLFIMSFCYCILLLFDFSSSYLLSVFCLSLQIYFSLFALCLSVYHFVRFVLLHLFYVISPSTSFRSDARSASLSSFVFLPFCLSAVLSFFLFQPFCLSAVLSVYLSVSFNIVFISCRSAAKPGPSAEPPSTSPPRSSLTRVTTSPPTTGPSGSSCLNSSQVNILFLFRALQNLGNRTTI